MSDPWNNPSDRIGGFVVAIAFGFVLFSVRERHTAGVVEDACVYCLFSDGRYGPSKIVPCKTPEEIARADEAEAEFYKAVYYVTELTYSYPSRFGGKTIKERTTIYSRNSTYYTDPLKPGDKLSVRVPMRRRYRTVVDTRD